MSNPLVDRTINQGLEENRANNGSTLQGQNPYATQYGQNYQNNPSMTPNSNQGQYVQQGSPQNPSQGKMTYHDVILKTTYCFAAALVGACAGWVLQHQFSWIGMLAFPVVLVLGIINALKKEPSPVLILLNAAALGILMGASSYSYENAYSGIVMQAVIATFVTFGVALAFFAFSGYRVGSKGMRFLAVALPSIGLFYLISWVMSLFGSHIMTDMQNTEVFGVKLGFFLSLIIIAIATFTLLSDFTVIEKGVKAGIPEKYSWTSAFSLTSTLVWLYMEFLRLLSYMQKN